MIKKLNIVSLFDGISCGRIALDRAGFAVNSYFAFEIDKYAKAISRYNYPDIKQCGDVFDADFTRFSDCDIVMGGSPLSKRIRPTQRKRLANSDRPRKRRKYNKL